MSGSDGMGSDQISPNALKNAVKHQPNDQLKQNSACINEDALPALI